MNNGQTILIIRARRSSRAVDDNGTGELVGHDLPVVPAHDALRGVE